MANWRTLRHQDYTVGWICALRMEMAMAKGLLDELHVRLPNASDDPFEYTLGRIGPSQRCHRLPTSWCNNLLLRRNW
jgi:hypothetical protein